MNARDASAQPPLSAYRADIDGLRALSIALVLGFHAFPDVVRGGFIGVDIFFVISGYLITGIITAEQGRGRFTFAHFYARRIRRLFPALVLVLAASLVAGWLVLLPAEYQQVGKHVVTGSTFIANIALWREADYFDSALKPLLHLWSLGVEEQFYLFWPLVLIIVARWRWVAISVTLLIVVVSFVLNVWAVHRAQSAAFFLPMTRVWELLAGALLAMSPWRPKVWADALSAAGFGLIAAGLLLINKAVPFPGWYALLPVGGAVLVIAGRGSWLNRRVLSPAPVVYLGLISYPLYLWHWPLLCFAALCGYESAGARATLIAVSVVLAIATYEWVEKPLRRDRTNRPVVWCIGLSVLVAVIGALVWRGVLEARSAAFRDVAVAAAAAGDWDFPGDLKRTRFQDLTLWGRGDAERGAVLIVGDSTMQQYAPRVNQLFNEQPDAMKQVMFAALGGCPPIPGARGPAHPQCTTFMDAVDDYLAKHPAETIIIGAQWAEYFSGDANHYFQPPAAPWQPLTQPAGAEPAFAALQQWLTKHRQKGQRLILILNTPIGFELNPKGMIIREPLRGRFALNILTLTTDDMRGRVAALNGRLRAIASAAGADVIDPMDFLCGPRTCDALNAAGVPRYKDGAHLHPDFVRHEVRYLDALLIRSP